MSSTQDGAMRDHSTAEHPVGGSGSGDPLLAQLESVVGGDDAWLTVPDLVELLDSDVSRVRRLLDDRLLVGVRRGRPKVLQVPRALAEPEPLVSLPGTVTVLTDAGYSDGEALRWLFTHDETLGDVPVRALRSGRVAPVRRRAQVLLF